MKNFEKFNNKQISEVESAKVMGGNFYYQCEGAQAGFCVQAEYHYQKNIIMNCAPSDVECRDTACSMAIAFCTMG